MNKIKYKLNKDIIARNAAMLSWSLNQVKSCINIFNKNRVVNGKSLVGILSGDMRKGDVIIINIDRSTDLNYIKKQFNEVGREVNG